MVATNLEMPDTINESVPVRVGGRLYPVRLRQSDLVPSDAEAEAPQHSRMQFPELKSDGPTLQDRIAADLWKCLPLSRIATPAGHDHTSIVRAYIASLEQVHRFQTDAERLIRVICETNFEFHQGSGTTHEPSRAAAVEAKMNEMIAKAGFTPQPVNNALVAELVVRPLDHVHSELHAELRRSLEEFVQQFFGAFEQMVDQQLIGLIEWAGPNVCRYHFFKQILIQETDGTRTERKTLSERRSSHFVHVQEKVDEITTRRHVHRLARHEHHVMKAFHTSIANTKCVVPQHVRPLLAAIPQWLNPYVQVIDGEIFRERIVANDYHTDTLEEVQSHVETIDRPIYGAEPAVVVEQFVLTGWGPREIDVEQQRQARVRGEEREHQESTLAAQRTLNFLAASGLSQFASWMLASLGYRAVTAGFWFSLFAAAGALATTILSVRRAAQARRTAPAWITQLSAGLTAILVNLSGQAVVAAYWNPSARLALGVLAFFVIASTWVSFGWFLACHRARTQQNTNA